MGNLNENLGSSFTCYFKIAEMVNIDAFLGVTLSGPYNCNGG